MKQKLLTPLILFFAATLFLAACASDEAGVSTSGSPDDAAADGDSPGSPDDLAADGPSTSDQPDTSDQSDTPDESDQPSEPDVQIDPDVAVDKLEPAQPLPEAPEVEPVPNEIIGGGSYPIATLDITISHPDAADISYTISCLGDTATVIGEVDIDERVACERLADDAVRTRLVEGVPKGQICTEQYGGPDVATIVGTYDGVDRVSVATTINRVNGCGIGDWDFLLAGILPAPRES